MKPFLLAFAAPFLANFAWIEWHVGRWGVLYLSEHLTLVLMLIVIPPAAAAFAARFVQVRRPRRWLSRPAPRPLLSAFLGLLMGCLSLLSAAVAMYFLPEWPESALLAISSLLVALAGVWLMPCARPGLCRRCYYDISGSLESGRCPECGTAFA